MLYRIAMSLIRWIFPEVTVSKSVASKSIQMQVYYCTYFQYNSCTSKLYIKENSYKQEIFQPCSGF